MSNEFAPTRLTPQLGEARICHCEWSEAISLWGLLSHGTRDFTPRNDIL